MLLPVEETRVYGYLTNTNIKFVLITEDDGPNNAVVSTEIQRLFGEIHELYVQEIMNPFNNINNTNKLSRKFDERIQEHVVNFNQTEI